MIVFLTGAGLSANSGLPTYRGENGVYTNAPDELRGQPIQEFLTLENARKNPEDVAAYLAGLKEQFFGAEPNDIHRAIAYVEQVVGPKRCTVFTQNIDDLHEQAGSTNVIHLHGDMENPILFGQNLRPESLQEMDFVLPSTKLCVIVGTSVIFPYMMGWLEMLGVWGCDFVLLDTDPKHYLNEWVNHHETDPAKFPTIIKDLVSNWIADA